MDAPTSADRLVVADAYGGEGPVIGRFAVDRHRWAIGAPAYGAPKMRPDPPDPTHWWDPRVGWGVVLPEPADRSTDQLATASDAPDSIQALIAARRGKVLRYRAGSKFGDWTFRDYAGDGDLLTAASPIGSGPKELPRYLLIYGPPSQVPWHVQFALNPVRCVGRLDLLDDALDRYVSALLDEWSQSRASYAKPVVWAVDHGPGDITSLMRDTVAHPLYARLRGDGEMPGATFLDGPEATAGVLTDALAEKVPALVVTSSHGMTGPLSDRLAMRNTLGLPVDQQHQPVTPARLLADWQPDGAIWFAQACCSAGSESPSAYAGLFDAGSELDRTLTGIAGVGAMTSPLARALLGAEKPLRAFIGHVEPTFNWTLEFPPNRQVLTSDFETAMYTRLCGGLPVGLALAGMYPAIATLLTQYLRAKREYEDGFGAAANPWLDMLVYSRVAAHDRASTVILGDPTVAMRLPAATG